MSSFYKIRSFLPECIGRESLVPELRNIAEIRLGSLVFFKVSIPCRVGSRVPGGYHYRLAILGAPPHVLST